MQRGVAKGYPVVDIRVTLTDGKSHSVDSSDAAFQSAGALALREAARDTTIALLEPYDEVQVVVPDDHLGAVMSDLSSRRGHLLGTDKVDAERTAVRAHVPQTELVRYAVELRGSTHGSGTFTRSFAHHEAMPVDLSSEVGQRS
jgi:elongation factor G